MHFGLESNGPYLLYAASIIVLLVSLFWRSDFGFYYIVLLLPLQKLRYELHGLPLGDSLIDVLLLGVLLGALFRGEVRLPRKESLSKWLLLFAVFLYVSLWRGSFYLGAPLPLSIDDPRFSDWKNYVEMPVFCLVTATIVKDVRQMKLLIVAMCFSLLLVNVSFYHTVSGRDLSHFSYDVRYSGQLGYADVNGLAAFEVMFFVFLWSLRAFESRGRVKLAILGAVLTCVYCLLFSFSRGGYVGFIAGLIFLGILKERKLLIVPLALVIGWQVFLPESVKERMTMTYEEDTGLDTSAGKRLILWQDALEMFTENPLFGSGFDTYGYLGRVGRFRDTHNYYLKVLVETGVLGLTIFLWLLWKFFRLGYSVFKSAEDPFLASLGLGFAAMVVCAFILNLFGDRWTYQQVDGYFWIVLGCVLRGKFLLQEAVQASNSEAGPVAVLSEAANPAVPA